MATRTLFHIGADLVRVYDAIEDTDPADPTQGLFGPDALGEWFAALQEEEGVKLDGYVGLIKQLEMEAAAARSEAEEWEKRATVLASKVTWLKSRMLGHLLGTGREKAVTASGRVIAVQNNGGVPPVVLRDDVTPEDLPAQFVKVVKVVNKEAVRKALEGGEVLDFAQIAERGRHLRIR